MRRILWIPGTLMLLIMGCLISPVSAQKYELHPYIGYFNPDGSDFGDFKDEGIYGLKGGVYLTDRFELEGNFGYINHFELKGTDPEARGWLWEVSGDYSFPISRVEPFISGGVGGLTAGIGDFFEANEIFNEGPNRVNLQGNILEDGDTFLMMSYGGGVKAVRLWGPVGLRADLRGRTLPNVFGDSATWLEATGGIIFSWGER